MKALGLSLLLITLASCVAQRSTSSSTKSPLPQVEVKVDMLGNGDYTPRQLVDDEIPQPLQGKMQWFRDFYSEINYPASARDKGIQGVVELESHIDEYGKVSKVEIKTSLSEKCDQEAKRAYLLSTQKGYSPLVIEGQARAFIVTVPVGFWLE